MDDRGQRVLGGSRVDQGRQLGGVGTVAGADGDLGTQPIQALRKLGRPDAAGAASGRQQQPAHTVVSEQVFGEQAAEHAGAPGDQHGARRVECRRGDEHDFPGRPGLADIPKRLASAQQPVGRHGRGLDDRGIDQLAHRGPGALQPFGRGRADVVDDVSQAGMGLCDVGGFPDVASGDLDKAPGRGQ